MSTLLTSPAQAQAPGPGGARFRTGLLLGLACALAGLAPLAAQAAPTTVQLVCGGIGGDESSTMLADAPRHALTIIFAGSGGAYLSGVATQVSGSPGTTVSDANCGPIGQVDVSKVGRYTVVASYAGKRQEKVLNLTPGGGNRLVLRWPDDEAAPAQPTAGAAD